MAGGKSLMDSDRPDTPDDASQPQPPVRLRYDEPHPQPPAPMFVRLSADPPSEPEQG